MSPALSHQLPSNLVAAEFGEINIRPVGRDLEVSFTILKEPEGADAEGWQTGVALDASHSMKAAYGRALDGTLPDEVAADYEGRGWLREVVQDGRKQRKFDPRAYQDALSRGYLRRSTNVVEPLARDFIGYLASNLDADGGTTVLYWACGDGASTELLGDYTAEQCRSLAVNGPTRAGFGSATHLRPAVEYFVERFRDARRGMYLFLTDGALDDLAEVKRYTTKLAREIADGRRHGVKCVLIGVGDRIDEAQMEQLDDLDTGTDVDIWDHKIAREMRGLVEIFAEVVDENQIVAPSALVYDASGKLVKTFSDGLPAKASFTMPVSSPWFELEVGGERIRQPVQVGR